MTNRNLGPPIVGQIAERSRLVTARDIELFTELSGDYNPLHYDEELAAGTRLGGIVVQGGVGSAILNAIVAEDLPGPGSVFLELNLRFAAPIRPGDVITGSVEVTSVRTDKPITGLTVRATRLVHCLFDGFRDMPVSPVFRPIARLVTGQDLTAQRQRCRRWGDAFAVTPLSWRPDILGARPCLRRRRCGPRRSAGRGHPP